MQNLQSSSQKFVSRTFSSEMQRPSGAYEWQMPMPPAEPRPPARESRRVVPLEAQDASYLAASASSASLACREAAARTAEVAGAAATGMTGVTTPVPVTTVPGPSSVVGDIRSTTR